MQNPSIPGEWSKDTPKDTPREEQSDPVDTQSVPRSVGVVSEAGDVVDESGKTIGKLAEESDPKELVGKTVTTAGEVVTSAGDVVGKVVPPDDDQKGEQSEYTTAAPEKKKSSGFGLSGLRTVYNTVDGTFKPVTSRLGFGSKSGSEAKSTPQSEATEKQPLEQAKEGSEINLQDQDESTTGKETGLEGKDDLQEMPPVAEGETKSDFLQGDYGDTVKPDDSISKFDDTSKLASDKKSALTESPEDERSVPPEDKVSETAPKTEGLTETKSKVESEIPKSDIESKAPTDTPRPEIPGTEGVEGSQVSKQGTEVPEGSQVSKQGTEVPEGSRFSKPATDLQDEAKSQAGTDAPKSEVSKSEVSKSEIPESQAPPSEVPPSEAPGTDIPGTDAPESDAPKSEAPGTETGTGVEGTEVPETEAPEGEEEKKLDYAALKGCRVNKGGNLVNDNGDKVGYVIEGEIKKIIGRQADENGDIWDDSGKKIGKGEPLPDSEREDLKDFAPFENFPGAVVDADGRVLFEGKQVGQVVEGDPKRLKGSKVDEDGDILDRRGNVVGKAEAWDEPEEEPKPEIDCSALKGCKVNKAGNLINDNGQMVGRLVEGEVKQLIGRRADENGDIWDDSGKRIGKGEPLPDNEREDLKDFAPFENFPGAIVDADGRVLFEGKQVGQVVEGDPKRLKGSKVDEDGDILDRQGNVIGKAEAWDEPEAEPTPEIDCSALKGCRVNKAGNLINDKGDLIGHVVEGDIKQLIGKRSDENGDIWDDSGKKIGKGEPLPDNEREDLKDFAPFENFPGAVVDADGRVLFEGKQVGQVIEGDPKRLKGSKVDEDGDILDRRGNVVGKAEPWDEPEAEPEPEVDNSALAGKRVNKAGNVVDSHGTIFGRVVEGHIGSVVGRMCDKDGNIRGESGDIIGRAELVPESEREGAKDGPFADLAGCTVAKEGKVVTEGGDVVGRLVSGDPKVLFGRPVDEDGDILDRNGNVIGTAERWEEPEPEPEAKIDYSALGGKRVNKAGNVVDSSGVIYGRVVEGHIGSVVGRMCDKDGNIRSESGDIIGRAELVPEGQREGVKDGPFADLQGCTVSKDGKVVTPAGDVVGRLISGDPKVLRGRGVDEDGDILDRNGNVIGKAERWEEEEVEKKKDPLAGRRVNREGNVVDEDGNLIGKLTSGDLFICSGKEVDEDGDVVNQKGQTIGHVTRLEDIPPEPEPEPEPEETETEEEKKQREQAETDKKLAGQLAYCVEQTLDKVRPICKMITDKIDRAERTPKEELDEEELVKQVKPLIEEGGRILTEANGAIRGLDPDGRIQRNAKHRSATREGSPEEFHLAEVLKELTGTVTQCIENAKRKIEDMPHAKEELNPLWGLLGEPLFQILAAVGLLLSGVLGIVRRLLSGLGLGGLIDGLLGGLGVDKILESLGLGSVLGALTGKDKKKKK